MPPKNGLNFSVVVHWRGIIIPCMLHLSFSSLWFKGRGLVCFMSVCHPADFTFTLPFALCFINFYLNPFCHLCEKWAAVLPLKLMYRFENQSQQLYIALTQVQDMTCWIWKIAFSWVKLFCWKMIYWYSKLQSSGTTYIVILVFLAVVVTDHRLGFPSALPLLAFVMAACLLTQLDLNPHRLGWMMQRQKKEQFKVLLDNSYITGFSMIAYAETSLPSSFFPKLA